LKSPREVLLIIHGHSWRKIGFFACPRTKSKSNISLEQEPFLRGSAIKIISALKNYYRSFCLIGLMLFCVQANALESLSYSGRLVQANGSPVTGPVNLRAELVYTNNTSTVLCSDDISGVALSKGVFHIKLDFACTGGKTLTQVLSLAPANESVAIQITDVSNSKSYSFQAIHAIPYANVASVSAQLEQNGAGDGEFLKWNDTLKQWKPGTVSGASGGTVTSVSVSAPMTITTPTSTPSITLPQASGSQSGYLSSADWTTFNSKQSALPAGGTSTHYLRGDNSWQTLNTDAVPEGTKLYFTNALALGVPLAGFSTATGAVVATDTILQAFGKIQGQINLKSDAASYVDWSTSGVQTIDLSRLNLGVGNADKVVVTNAGGFVITSGVTSTEVGYLNGVSSNIQNQLNNKQATITATSNVAMKELRLNELAVNGVEYTGFKSPDAITANVIYTLPTADGSNGQVLTTNSTGGLSWTTVSTSSSSLTGDVGGSIGANTIGAGKVTLTHLSATGTKDNTTYLRGDNTFASFAADVRSSVLTGLSTSTNLVITATDSVLSSLGKLQKQISDFAVSAVGGDLTGNLPNPTVAKIQGRSVTSTAPLASQVLKYNSVTPAWEPSYVLVGDLKSSALGNLFPGTGCAANQTLYYSVVGDAFTCVNIDILDASKITTGTIAAARLPSSATYWSSATGGINYASGNVGIGTSAPNATLDVVNTTGGAPSLRLSNTSTNMPYIMFQSGGFIQDIGAGMIRSRAVGATSALVFDTNSLERVRIDSAGNVGIGTVSPANKLDVTSAAGSVLIDGSGITQLRSAGESITSSGGIRMHSNNALFFTAENGPNPFISFSTNYSGAAVERMRVAAGGNVGIGTITPAYSLDVNGKIRGTTSANADLSTLGGPIYLRASTYNRSNAINATAIDDTAAGASLGDVATFTGGWTGSNSITKDGGFMPGMYDVYVRIRTNGAGNLPTLTAFGIYDNTTTSYPLNTTLMGLTSSYQEIYAGRASLSSSTLSHPTTTFFSTSGATTTYYVDYVKFVPAPIHFGDVGIGTNPSFKLDVNGLTALAGSSSNLDPAGSPNLAAIQNTGKMLVGWNRNAGNGEIDFISNRAGGAGGGFSFYDYTNAGALNNLVNFNGNGNVGIGVVTPNQKLEVAGTILSNNGFIGTNLINGAFTENTSRAFLSPAGYIWSTMNVGSASSNLYLHRNDLTNYFVQFGYGAAGVGSISTNGSSVSYNTTSDYRLKENVKPMENAIERVLMIQPKRFNYIRNPKETVDGFIAHELAKAVPEAVTGKKDAVDKEGKIIPQLVDYSKVIPVVTGAVKELYKKFLGHDEQLVTQSRAIASLEAEKADKTKVQILEKENAQLRKEILDIKAYLCRKDRSAPICK
jgi:hypothetical protein